MNDGERIDKSDTSLINKISPILSFDPINPSHGQLLQIKTQLGMPQRKISAALWLNMIKLLKIYIFHKIFRKTARPEQKS